MSGWEDALRDETPRGFEGKADAVPYARWRSAASIGDDWLYARDKIFLGYRDKKAIGYGDKKHVMLVAGSRAGKGESIIIPNLLLYQGPVLALDPKGELARVTARQRAQGLGQTVHVLDPFNQSGEATRPFRASFNPLEEIDLTSDDAIDDAALIADALVIGDHGGGGDKHWTDAARELVKILILDALTQPEDFRNLDYVWSFFKAPAIPATPKNPGTPGYMVRLREMWGKGQAFDGALAGGAMSFADKNEGERTSIISTAQVQLGFLDSTPLKNVLLESSFRLEELKTGKTTVYMCLPAIRMATHGKWFRIVVNLLLLMCERVKVLPDPPLLVMLEEFAVLSYLRALEAAAGQIAGLGVKLFTVLQDLTQLQRHYDKGWETFVGNSGLQIFFGNSDVTTLDYVSRKLGTIGFDLTRPTGATVGALLSGARSTQEQLQHSRLLEAHEVERMFARRAERALILHSDFEPLVVKRAIYHANKPFEGLFDPPY